MRSVLMLSLIALAAPWLTFHVSAERLRCKANPIESTWPRWSEWTALNHSIEGALISTSPVASSCWNDTRFNSPFTCSTVESNWTSSTFHAALPESIGAFIFANNSCVPPDSADGDSLGCQLGGLPSYVVNATNTHQVATAMKWASERNLRVVIKGTGHDLNGR